MESVPQTAEMSIARLRGARLRRAHRFAMYISKTEYTTKRNDAIVAEIPLNTRDNG